MTQKLKTEANDYGKGVDNDRNVYYVYNDHSRVISYGFCFILFSHLVRTISLSMSLNM